MPYESTITFTLDTICPWTYLAFLRLTRALSQYRTTPSPPVSFTLKFLPYQLYPDFSAAGEDKYIWYKREKYNDDEEKMELYMVYMTALGVKEGVEMDFKGGSIANTLEAHRVLFVVQERFGEEGAWKCLESLYAQYFSEQQHPSSPSTLTTACLAAGLSEDDAKELVEGSEGLAEVRIAIREQKGDGVDSVPYLVVEGRRRDFTLVGAKEEGEYGRVMAQVGKEV
ncbi:thioredoxin-like protein [Amniculicola lignicola CBS 123094]|uniref:Thioredoxin-like protein n=1 Tax=Amniculicola lignicola CBS 123094 TaxID=1392246 RepID=A0A6A5WVW5_9PLEO|nr:thioredoxin-like protein [Amniculicola lignicola CBS 123094]